MKTRFEWKCFTDKMPKQGKLIVICSKKKKKIGYFIGQYICPISYGIHPFRKTRFEFRVCKMNPNTFTKQKTKTSCILDDDKELYHWDYYNPYWNAPGSFENSEELFYKKNE